MLQRGVCGALVEHVTPSPVMHASRVRIPLILLVFLREISLFLPFKCDSALGNFVDGGLFNLSIQLEKNIQIKPCFSQQHLLDNWAHISKAILIIDVCSLLCSGFVPAALVRPQPRHNLDGLPV